MNNNLVALVIIVGIEQVEAVIALSIDIVVELVNAALLGGQLAKISAIESSGHADIVSLIRELVLSAVDLDLLVFLRNSIQIVQRARSYNGAVLSVDAVNSGLVASGLVQNVNLQAVQFGVVLRGLQCRRGMLSYGVGELILVLIIRDLGQLAGCFFQAHVLLADGRVVVVSALISRGNQLHVGVLAVAQNYGVSKYCIVDQLCSVLTRASGSEGSGYVLQQAVLVSQCVGLGCPACAGQTSLLSIVTQGYQQHLSSFLSGYLVVRAELGVALTSNDAQRLAVLDVAASPVGANVGERGLVVVVRRSVRITGAQNVDHLRHLRTGYGTVRLERAVVVAVNYAQRYQSVHNFGVNLDVSRIRERRTSKHGECTSKRQYQCEKPF